MNYTFEIAFDHFQILVGDLEHGPFLDTTELWSTTEKAIASLPNDHRLVAIGTARFGGKTNFSIKLTDGSSAIPNERSEWTVLGEFQLDIPSGKLAIWAPETTDIKHIPQLSLQPGFYWGRAYSQGTDLVVDEMDVEGPDEYLIVLWR